MFAVISHGEMRVYKEGKMGSFLKREGKGPRGCWLGLSALGDCGTSVRDARAHQFVYIGPNDGGRCSILNSLALK